VNSKLLFLPAPKKEDLKKQLPFLLPALLAFLIVLTSWQKFNFFLDQKAQFKVGLWPQIPSAHFAFARDLFQKGQGGLSQKEFKVGKKQVESLDKTYLGFLFKKILSYRIYEDGAAKKAWRLAYWLNPNNKEVLGLGEKLGF